LSLVDTVVTDCEGDALPVTVESGVLQITGGSTSTSVSSTTTTTVSPVWPFLYNEIWGEKKDENLSLLRTFRDDVLVSTALGRKYVGLLYGNSFEIALLLVQNPLLLRQAGEWLNVILDTMRSPLFSDRPVVRQSTIKSLEILLNRFAVKTTNRELINAIRNLGRDIKDKGFFMQLGIAVATCTYNRLGPESSAISAHIK